MDKIRPKIRPLSTKTQDLQNSAKSAKTSRKGPREARELSFNKPIRNIKFLEISRVNSILPDKYQLGLQPIKKKETVSNFHNKQAPVIFRAVAESQTDPKV
jgi:hypothetical protein